MAGITEKQLAQLKANINSGKKKPQENLFGETVGLNTKLEYEETFRVITADKQYIWIPGNVVGKKNNYEAFSFYTGKSICCNAAYDKKTQICEACGKVTKSDRKTGKIDLNKRAMAYKNDTLPTFMKNVDKFKKLSSDESFHLVGIFLLRDSARRFDFDNMKTMIGDQLSSSGMINDDSGDKLMLIPLGYLVKPKTPGLIMRIFNHLNYFNFIRNECRKNQ